MPWRWIILCLVSAFPFGCSACGAPGPLGGLPVGQVCAADLDCADGLTCRCGRCSAPDGRDLPPACDVEAAALCPETPSVCVVACGDPQVAGAADCVEGVESCVEVGGVLAEDCPPETCWGEPPRGAVCVQGEFVCELGESSIGGACYTRNCAGDPSSCILDDAGCAAEFPDVVQQVCVDDAWVCEAGTDIESCGGCLGPPPTCYASCTDPTPVSSAFCDNASGGFSCDHIEGTVLSDSCPCLLGDQSVDSVDALSPLASASCVYGDVRITTSDVSELVLAELTEVEGDLTVAASTLREVHLPQLASVQSLVVQGNPSLSTVDAPQLTTVGLRLVVTDNPSLSTCIPERLLGQLAGAPPLVLIEANAPAADDCSSPPERDAGLPVAEGDGGSAAGGDPSADGGALDAG